MESKSIGFIGGGRITKIFLQGFSNPSVPISSIKIFEPDGEILKKLTSAFPAILQAKDPADAAAQDIVFIAVHPPVVMEILQLIRKSTVKSTVVVSLAPKITLQKMASILPTRKLIRMIPNATSFINKGYNPVSFHPDFNKKEKKNLLKMFKILGKTFETEESKLESYAVVSAMLPTYFWFQWQELIRIGQKTGLDKSESRKAVQSSLKKAISIFFNSELSSEEIMDLIPVKPIGEYEKEISDIYNTRLMEIYGKIKP